MAHMCVVRLTYMLIVLTVCCQNTYIFEKFVRIVVILCYLGLILVYSMLDCTLNLLKAAVVLVGSFLPYQRKLIVSMGR